MKTTITYNLLIDIVKGKRSHPDIANAFIEKGGYWHGMNTIIFNYAGKVFRFNAYNATMQERVTTMVPQYNWQKV